MKRLMPASLINFLQTNKNCLRADLFSIFLPTGQTLNVTSGQWDLTVPAGTPGWDGPTITFYALRYGRWSRGTITSEASFNLNSNSMSLTLAPQAGVTYPGLDIGMLNAVLNGLFDAAPLYVYTTYMPLGQYGTHVGIETKFFGAITKVTSVTRVVAEFECSDPFYLFNLKIPTRLLQSNCPWSFGDGNCNPPVSGSALVLGNASEFIEDSLSTVQMAVIGWTPTTGQSVTLGTMTGCSWLSGKTVSISAVSRLQNTAYYTITFSDPTSHGIYGNGYSASPCGGTISVNTGSPTIESTYSQVVVADGTSTQWIINPTVTTGKMAIANYFTQGVITCLVGSNAGLSQTVKAHSVGAPYLYMMNKWLLPVSAGDTFSVFAGCDKTMSTCQLKFNNLTHFSGFPFIPVPTTAL